MESIIFSVIFIVISHLLLFFIFKGRYYAIFLSHASYVLVISFIQFSGVVEFGDIADYLPYFTSFSQHLSNGDILSFIKPHAPIYVLSFPGWLFSINDIDSFFAIRLVNTCISILIIWPIDNIYRKVFGVRLKVFQVFLVLLWLPFAFRLSGELGRTPVSIFSILLAIDLLLSKDVRFKSIGLVVMTYAIALRVPHVVMFVPVLIYPMWTLFRVIKFKYRLVLFPVLAGLVLVVSLSFVGVFYKFSGENRQFESMEDISEYSEGRGYGNSAYLLGMQLSMSSIIYYIPVHALYFNYSPMIWDSLTNIKMLASSLFSLFSFYLLIRFLRMKSSMSYNKRKLKILTYSFLLSISLFGMVTKNAGSAERWRMPITLIYIAVLSHSLRSDCRDIN
ncbi:hypothetical protein [Vibrio hangzhouensis]|uniref:hypothetical protein n=1 Tax=Vibrio hangzhouensis TaxID=462991 RepID=UPI001C947773|nr:hypothetical protein [Vibrio hangzhouensis]MBY6198477.1 hypothetical protein [Vibrio hangzhouensis]